jgi:hypothetical protein
MFIPWWRPWPISGSPSSTGALADFFAPTPDCYYDRTLRAVWRRRPLGKVILRDIAATAGGPSSYRFGTLGILAGIRQTV